MRRGLTVLSLAIVSIFVLGLLIAPLAALAGGNCDAKLANKSFACTIKNSDGIVSSDCWEFTPTGPSAQFNFFDSKGLFGCTCDVSGTFKSPSFDNSSSAFECDDGAGDQIYGKLKGKKITGAGSDTMGDSLLFSCTIGPSCG